jgi:hypothetical protein
MSNHSFRKLRFETSRPLHPIAVGELESVEQALRCRFPSDYRDFVLRFGSGEFDQISLCVQRPSEILQRTDEDRARLAKYWFWDHSPDVWSQARAVESIACFDGTSGDDIRFHPSDLHSMYLLPHEDNFIIRFTSFADIVHHFRRTFSPDLSRLVFR